MTNDKLLKSLDKLRGGMEGFKKTLSTTTTEPTPLPTEPSTEFDTFGIKKIYPTSITKGFEWDSKFATTGNVRTLDTNKSTIKNQQDTIDKNVWMPRVGDGVTTFNGNGTFTMKGKSPRIVIVPTSKHLWQNIESTVYVKPIKGAESIDIRPKTNHYCVPTWFSTQSDHDLFGGYTFVIHYKEQNIHHKKEQTHNLGYTSRLGQVSKTLPQTKFIGIKSIVTNISNEQVRVQSFVDLTEGLSGGEWIKVTDITDDKSSKWTINGVTYAPYVESCVGSAIRCNSATYAEYMFKNWSVREIEPSS